MTVKGVAKMCNNEAVFKINTGEVIKHTFKSRFYLVWTWNNNKAVFEINTIEIIDPCLTVDFIYCKREVYRYSTKMAQKATSP